MTTYSALYYHVIWATKGRAPSIVEKVENQLHAYITGIVQATSGSAIQVGGMPDHIHMLVRLKPQHSITELIKSIKIASGKWIKENVPAAGDFSWQTGYGIFSVSKSQTDVVKHYIMNQKEHHRSRGFDEEWLCLLQHHGIEYNENYVFG